MVAKSGSLNRKYWGDNWLDVTIGRNGRVCSGKVVWVLTSGRVAVL